MGHWFRQREKAQGLGLILVGIPLASVLGAPISWRWLLILEELPAVTCAYLAKLWLPNGPDEARFLTDEEKAWITEQLDLEERQKTGAQSLSVLQTLTHPRVWHLACIGFASGFGTYTFSFWLPQIMKSVSSGPSNTAVDFS